MATPMDEPEAGGTPQTIQRSAGPINDHETPITNRDNIPVMQRVWIRVLPQLVNIPVDGYAVVYDNINSGTIPRRTQSVNTLDAGTAAQIVPLQRSHSRNHDGEEVNEAVSVLGFELDKFQAECPARIMDGQDVFCINRTGAGKSTLISVPVIMREGTISLVVAPTNFLQRDMVASMQKKNISSVAINSETLTAAAFASPPRDLWAEAKTGAHRIIFIGPETMRTAAVDELHAADEWGVEFRKEFQDISTMRARLPEHTVFVGLSATIEPGRQFGSCAKLMAFQPGFHLEKQDCERRNVALIVRPIKYTSSGLEFRDLDWTVPPNLTKASDVAKLLIFVQTIDGGHRLVLYLRTLLPLHLQKDAQRLIRHHHSLACPDCKAEGLDSLYKLDEDRDCLIHVSTDVLTVGVDIPGLAAVIIYGKMSSASTVQQQAGRPARERGSTGKAYLYVTKADMADAMAYVKSDAGKLDKRVLAAKDATSHVRVAEPSTAPAEDSTDGTGETVDTLLDATARSEVDNVPTSTTQSVTAAKKSKKTKKIIAAPGVIAKPGARTCSSLLLIFAASGRDLCVTRQINMVYGNPGVDKDCGRCSSCIGDTVPEPRAKPTHADGGETDIVDPAAEKVPAYMKPQTKDLKMVTEKLEQSARTIQWNQPRGPDALLVGARIFLPPRIISAITTDFLLITSEEIFKTRVRDWKYAEDYTQALWNVTKVLVDNLSKELKTRHEEALEKQRDARVHKYLVTNGLAGITGVRLVIPKAVPANAATDDSATTAAIPESVEPVNIRSEVPPKDFYAGSPTRTPPRSKRKAQESWEDTGSPKRRKTMDKENAAPGATTSAKKVKKSAPPAHKKSKSAPKKS